MRTKTVLIYLSIFALLGGYFYYFEGVRRKARLAKEERARLLFQVEESNIRALKISPASGKPMALVRDGRWRLTEPIQSPVDEFVLRGLLSALARLRAERQVEATAQDVKPYGLDQPILRLAFEVEGRWHNLRIGGRTSVGDHFYATGDEEARVVLVVASQERALNKLLFDLRGKEPFNLKSDEIDRIEIVRSEGTIFLTRSEGKGWQAARNPAVKIKTAKVESLLTRLTSVRVTRFVEEPDAARVRLGLNPPRVRVTLGAGEGRQTLNVGAPGSNRGVYAGSDQLPGIFVVDEDVLKKVPAGLYELEDRTLLAFEREQVARLALRLAGNAVQLERHGDTWRTAKGEGGKPPEGWRVNALLRKVQDLEYLETAPSKRQELADGTGLHLVLTSRGGEPLGAISVSEIPAGEPTGGVLWFVKGNEEPRAYRVAADALRGLEEGMKQVLTPES